MTSCDMCGASSELCSAKVEGILMTLCRECSKFGIVVTAPKFVYASAKKKKDLVEDGPVETIVSDFGNIILKAREKAGLTQKEFAGKLNEKESLVQKLEHGTFHPSLMLAKKLEKLLHVKLIKIEENKEGELFSSKEKDKGSGLTIGDIIRIKKN
ncbi:TIGR00270 family protein [Candidatus Woesearchaeota archaeon CG10_big_fil_rev_8_21_14_0_10_37_12]|nr:MAG: TIGR00270 family protein [Candidatus Woesearchaeota archaeon CG10_big_fil_rev_8_21_14_0_10_37_12]